MQRADRIKQYVFLFVIAMIAVALAWPIRVYMPGILGAITLYILMRPYYFKLTVIKNWRPWIVAILFLLIAIIIFVVPIWLLLQTLLPKLYGFMNNPAKLNASLGYVSKQINKFIPQLAMDDTQIKGFAKNAASAVPTILGATLDMLINSLLAFFLLYYMLVDGRKMERTIQKFLPLAGENIDNIWEATRVMVVSNAIGIPVLAACEAVTAALGYYIFGVDSPVFWGIITGFCSLVPVIGTAIVWIPISAYLFAKGETGHGIGLLCFSMLIVSMDNVLRFTLLKRIGNVHPIITVLGIFVGVPLFGFMGFIFGPLLISYLLLLIEIYRVEFSPRNVLPPDH